MQRDPSLARRARTIATRPTVEVMEGRRLLAALMVTNALDSGAGSFRQAILDADSAQVTSTVDFSIPGDGLQTIALASALPQITAPLTIDGTTQPGYAGSPLVVLDGTNIGAGGGLSFQYGASESTVRGLALVRFSGDAILVVGPRVTIQANLIGVDPSGQPGGNNGNGVSIFGGNNSQGFGPAPGSVISNNVISSNYDGVALYSGYNTVIDGNDIGTDASGRTDLGNANDGVHLSGVSSFVTLSNNVIANNGRLGIDDISSTGTVLDNNVLSNNGGRVALIGLSASSTTVATSTGKVELVTYTVTNQGPNTATNVRFNAVSRTYATNFDLSGQPSGVINLVGAVTSQGTINLGANLNNFASSAFADLGTLAPGASAGITIAVAIVGSGTDSLDLRASSDQPTTSLFDNPFASTQFLSTGTADLAVQALPPPVAKVGMPETFTFVVKNRDPNYAVDAQFVLDFGLDSSSDMTGVLVSQGMVARSTSIPTPNAYICDLGTLPPGASAIVTAVIIPTQSGKVGATLAAYSTSDVDPNPTNNLAVAGAIASSSPTVLGALFQPGSGPIVSSLIDFSTPLTKSKAQDVRNYRLTTDGTRTRIAVQSATYDDATRSVTLRLSRSLARSGAPVRLVVGGPGTPGLTAPDGSNLVGGIARLTLNRG